MKAWCERDGKRQGPYTLWHKDGTLQYQVLYEGGEKHGVSVQWDPDGQLNEEGEFRNGRRLGWWRTYMSGKLLHEGEFVDGQQHGDFYAYAGNGVKNGEGQYRNGEPCGTFRCWDWKTEQPTGCIPLEHLCELTETGARCAECKD